MPSKAVERIIARQIQKNTHLDTKRGRFATRHGKSVIDRENDCIVFEDGARMEIGFHSGAWTREPPEEKYERALLVQRYHEIRVEQAIELFSDAKAWLAGGSGGNPFPDDVVCDEDRLEHLLKLKKKAQTEKRYLKTARSNVRKVEPDRVAKARRVDAQVEGDKENFKRRVNEISI